MWVEFVVGSRLTHRVFLQVLQFSSLHKNQHRKYQLNQNRGQKTRIPAEADVASSLNIVIYLFIIYFMTRIMRVAYVFL